MLYALKYNVGSAPYWICAPEFETETTKRTKKLQSDVKVIKVISLITKNNNGIPKKN